MIGILNYGLGNVGSFANIYKQKNIPYLIVEKPQQFEHCSRIILPGVGSFDRAMQDLKRADFIEPIKQFCLVEKKPLLGICVGMQVLARSSEEGALAGLDLIPGVVKKFDHSKYDLLLPHMGWNSIKSKKESQLLHSIEVGEEFYFLHSYYYAADSVDDQLVISNYGDDFSSVVSRGHIYGVQFHPEKSHLQGTQLLINFGTLVC